MKRGVFSFEVNTLEVESIVPQRLPETESQFLLFYTRYYIKALPKKVFPPLQVLTAREGNH